MHTHKIFHTEKVGGAKWRDGEKGLEVDITQAFIITYCAECGEKVCEVEIKE